MSTVQDSICIDRFHRDLRTAYDHAECFASVQSAWRPPALVSDRRQLFPLANILPRIRLRPLTALDRPMRGGGRRTSVRLGGRRLGAPVGRPEKSENVGHLPPPEHLTPKKHHRRHLPPVYLSTWPWPYKPQPSPDPNNPNPKSLTLTTLKCNHKQ